MRADAVMTFNGLGLGGMVFFIINNEYMTASLHNRGHNNYCATFDMCLFAIEIGGVNFVSTFPCEQKGLSM